MQPTNFNSLISPPWPATEKHNPEHESLPAQRDKGKLFNFERNEESGKNLDHIVMLGYN